MKQNAPTVNTENRKLGGKGKSHVPPARYHELTYLLAVFPNDVALYADEAAEFWFKYEPIFLRKSWTAIVASVQA